jgi:thioredoxin 1
MVKTITQDNFEAEILKADKTALLDFWAPWCAPCRMVGPVVETVAEEFGDQLVVGKLNVDENQTLAVHYGVRSIPTLIFFRGGEEIKRIVGAQNKTLLTQAVSELV